jgi:hypothetical protein
MRPNTLAGSPAPYRSASPALKPAATPGRSKGSSPGASDPQSMTSGSSVPFELCVRKRASGLRPKRFGFHQSD